MIYVDGYVTPVPEGGRAAYLDFTRRAWEMFRRLGALSTMECWGDEVPEGRQTDFRRAVRARPGETVVFSWIVWPDKATRETAMETMMSDETAKALGAMPFDGGRMICGGFRPIHAEELA